MKEVLGKGSNNVAGADGVEAVIKSYNGHKYKSFSSNMYYEDSNLLIKWIKRSNQIFNIHLKFLGDQVNVIANLLEVISFTHVFRGRSAVKRETTRLLKSDTI